MADGHAHGIAVTGDTKLAATAGGVAGGHGHCLRRGTQRKAFADPE
jgi:hypothetical protein